MSEEWKPGYPPGKIYEGMTNDYEVYFSPAGAVWYRRRTDDEKVAREVDTP